MLRLVILVVLASLAHCAEGVVIRVSSEGRDTPTCQSLDSSPCATLNHALECAQLYTSVSVLLSEGVYSLSANATVTTFRHMSRFELISVGGISYITCFDSGFGFFYSSNIHISNVSILGCGLVQNSSSSTQETSDKVTVYQEFTVGMYFLLCSNVTLDHLTVSETSGVGVVLYSTGGVNSISFSSFLNNIARDQGGGGMAIEFLYCIPGDKECSSSKPSHISEHNYQNVTFRIVNCTFETNIGNSTDNSNTFIIPNSNHNVALGRGGGLGVVFKGTAKNNTVIIDSCVFRNNTAIWGGGALFEFQDKSQDNVLVVRSTSFIQNACVYDPCDYKGTEGGGLRLLFAGFNSTVKNNHVLFSNVVFLGNRAYFGGGTSIMTFPEIQQTTNAVKFTNVTWESNTACLGAAVDLSVWHLTFNGSVIRPVFEDCIFQFNTIRYTDNLGTAKGAGTIYADTVPTAFSGNARFFHNVGSGVYCVEADVEFWDEAKATFESNIADNGAGIALHGNSYLQMYSGTSLEFFDNVVALYGGAIYWEGVGNRYLISSRNCFIRYVDYLLDPSHWPVSLSFSGNVAGVAGLDIYGTALLGCLWGGKPYGDFIKEADEYRRVFNWSSAIWHYNNFSNNSIATAPGHFTLENRTMCGVADTYLFHAVPGGYAHFNISMWNDRYFPSDAVVFSAVVDSMDDTNSTSVSVKYLSSGVNISVPGTVGEHRVYNISTLYPRVISSEVILEFDNCPLGFKFDSKSRTCIGGNFPYIRINANLTTSIQRGYWIGNISDASGNDHTVVSQCFFLSI